MWLAGFVREECVDTASVWALAKWLCTVRGLEVSQRVYITDIVLLLNRSSTLIEKKRNLADLDH
jgi:hypothetical protein